MKKNMITPYLFVGFAGIFTAPILAFVLLVWSVMRLSGKKKSLRAMSAPVMVGFLLPFCVLDRLLRNMWTLNIQAFKWTAGETRGYVADLRDAWKDGWTK